MLKAKICLFWLKTVWFLWKQTFKGQHWHMITVDIQDGDRRYKYRAMRKVDHGLIFQRLDK